MPDNDNKKIIESNKISKTLQDEQDNIANNNNLQDEESAQFTASSLFDEPLS
jgi:hypothetical protein